MGRQNNQKSFKANCNRRLYRWCPVSQKRCETPMKHLPIYTKAYRELIRDFQLYLERLGYNRGTQSALPSQLQEFFHRLEQQGTTELNQITVEHIEQHHEYLKERPNKTRPGTLSESQITSHLFALKTFFNYQEESGNITSNPFSVISYPRPKKTERMILTQDQVKQLYEACETLRDRAILALFYGCGLRKEEAEKININDIHFKQLLLYVRQGKGKKRRVIPLGNQVNADLQNYYLYERSSYLKKITGDSQNAFMLNKHGTRMMGLGYYNRVKELLKKAALPKQISLHHLRHSIATHLLESGLSMEQVRDFLGHVNLETTQLYTRISKKYLTKLIV